MKKYPVKKYLLSLLFCLMALVAWGKVPIAQATTPCTSDQECGKGEYCNGANVCVPQTCTSDQECGSGAYCVGSGICVTAADLNQDGKVDISDYSLLVKDFMRKGNNLRADLNKDGLVDISDYSLLINDFSL